MANGHELTEIESALSRRGYWLRFTPRLEAEYEAARARSGTAPSPPIL